MNGKCHFGRRTGPHPGATIVAAATAIMGVLIALILVIIVAVPVAFHIVKGISSAIFGGDQNQLVYQIDNSRACQDGKAVDLGAAPYRNGGSTAFVPIDSLCANLGLELTWDSAGTTASVTYKGDTANLKVGSTVLTYNGQDQTLSAAPETKEGVTYVPVRDVCQKSDRSHVVL